MASHCQTIVTYTQTTHVHVHTFGLSTCTHTPHMYIHLHLILHIKHTHTQANTLTVHVDTECHITPSIHSTLIHTTILWLHPTQYQRPYCVLTAIICSVLFRQQPCLSRAGYELIVSEPRGLHTSSSDTAQWEQGTCWYWHITGMEVDRSWE